MTIETLISTIISLAFLYSVLALFTSELQEYLVAIFESRAKRLKQSIRQILGEQDWPFYPLEFNGSKNIATGSTLWIKDSKINETIEDPNNLGKFFVKGAAVTKYPVSEIDDPSNPGSKVLVWGKNTSVNNVKDIANLTVDNQFIWISNADEKTEFKQANVIEDPNKLDNGFLKDIATTKCITLKEINADSVYWLDISNESQPKIIDNSNLEIAKLDNFLVGSLTEKLYQHRTIRALNQSGFAWLSLRKDSTSVTYFVFGISALILSSFSLYFKISWLLILSWAIFIAAIFGFTFYYTRLNAQSGKIRNEDKLGKVRKSVGPSYMDADVFASTLIDVIKRNTSQEIDDIEARLNSLEFYTPAKSTLRNMLDQAKITLGPDPNIQQLIQELTNIYKKSFDEVQERSSGVYKRNAKGLSLLIGLLIAILLNADTFYMVTQLTRTDNKTASNIVAELEKKDPELFNQSCPSNDSKKCLQDKLSQLSEIYKGINTLPLGWETPVAANGDPQSQSLKNKPLELTQSINTTVAKQGGWFIVPLGWLITAIALSMGAPFWFDLLGRIMNVRNGKKNDGQ